MHRFTSTPVLPFRAPTSDLLAIHAGGAGAGAGAGAACMYPCVVIDANLRVYPSAPAARNLGTRSQGSRGREVRVEGGCAGDSDRHCKTR